MVSVLYYKGMYLLGVIFIGVLTGIILFFRQNKY